MEFTASMKVGIWYCSNCGTRLSAIRDKEGKYKAQCPLCKACSVRKPKGRRHETIEFYWNSEN